MKQNHHDKVSDEELIEAYKQTPHIGKLAAKFSLPQVSIWRRGKRLGLKFISSGKGHKVDLMDILEGRAPQYQTYKLKLRILEEGILENVCSVCSISEWQGKPLALQLDHINGLSSDHRLENLRLICPNCHSQTDTYCGRNK